MAMGRDLMRGVDSGSSLTSFSSTQSTSSGIASQLGNFTQHLRTALLVWTTRRREEEGEEGRERERKMYLLIWFHCQYNWEEGLGKHYELCMALYIHKKSIVFPLGFFLAVGAGQVYPYPYPPLPYKQRKSTRNLNSL